MYAYIDWVNVAWKSLKEVFNSERSRHVVQREALPRHVVVRDIVSYGVVWSLQLTWKHLTIISFQFVVNFPIKYSNILSDWKNERMKQSDIPAWKINNALKSYVRHVRQTQNI